MSTAFDIPVPLHEKQIAVFDAFDDGYREVLFRAGEQSGKSLCGCLFFWRCVERCLDPNDPWYGGSGLVITPTYQDWEKGGGRTMQSPAGPPGYGFGELWDALGSWNEQTHTYTIRYTDEDPKTGRKRRRTIKVFFVSANEGTSSVIAVRAQWAWWDEADKSVKNIYEDLLSRTSTTSGPILMTTTPYGGKYSWIREWERQAARDSRLGRAIVTASRVDNPAVSNEVLLRDKAAMTPRQFRRRVLGEHSYEEGMVYSMFHSEAAQTGGHLVDSMPWDKIPEWWDVYCGIDLGARWFGVVWMLRDEDDHWYVADSWLSENEPTVHRADVIANHPLADRVKAYIYDPSGRQGAIDFRDHGFRRVWPAENKVAPGLDTVGRYLSDYKLHFWDTPRNLWLINEFDMYHFDAMGKLVEEDDHGCDTVRYVLQTAWRHLAPQGPRADTRAERMAQMWGLEQKDPRDRVPSHWMDF